MIAVLSMSVVTITVLAICWSIIHELMRPIILQREREAKCQHAFETRVHNSEGIVFETRFCPRCAGVRVIAAGDRAGPVRRPAAAPPGRPGKLAARGKGKP